MAPSLRSLAAYLGVRQTRVAHAAWSEKRPGYGLLGYERSRRRRIDWLRITGHGLLRASLGLTLATELTGYGMTGYGSPATNHLAHTGAAEQHVGPDEVAMARMEAPSRVNVVLSSPSSIEVE